MIMTSDLSIAHPHVRPTAHLVRRFASLQVTGARRRLTSREVRELTGIVNELRQRHVLD